MQPKILIFSICPFTAHIGQKSAAAEHLTVYFSVCVAAQHILAYATRVAARLFGGNSTKTLNRKPHAVIRIAVFDDKTYVYRPQNIGSAVVRVKKPIFFSTIQKYWVYTFERRFWWRR